MAKSAELVSTSLTTGLHLPVQSNHERIFVVVVVVVSLLRLHSVRTVSRVDRQSSSCAHLSSEQQRSDGIDENSCRHPSASHRQETAIARLRQCEHRSMRVFLRIRVRQVDATPEPGAVQSAGRRA